MKYCKKNIPFYPARTALACLVAAMLLSCSGKPELSGTDARISRYYSQLKEASGNNTSVTGIREFLRDSLDLAVLYQSALWHECLSAWVSSYPATDSATAASQVLIERAAQQSPATLTSLVRELCLILKNRGELQAAATIAALPYGIDAGQNPGIAARLLVSTLLPGQPAPSLTNYGGTTIRPGSDGRKTVLFFYESGCGICQEVTDEMTERYGELQKSGIRVISISSDSDREPFEEYSQKFPWKEKLCDFLGFGSPNFKSYGVAATPTLFLIDGKGTVTGQYGSVEEMQEAGLGNSGPVTSNPSIKH